MIPVDIIYLFEALVNAVFGPITSVAPSPPGLAGFASTIVGDSWFQHLGWANDYLPLDAIISAAGVVFGFWSVMWVVRLVIWILSKSHVLGGGDE